MPDVVCQFVGIGMVPWYMMKRGGQFERLLCDMEKSSMWTTWSQSTMLEALSSPLWWTYANLVGSSSSGAGWTGASLVWGSVIDQLWDWAGAKQVLHGRAGDVSAKMEARLYCICAYFLCAIAVMHAYECVSGNKSGACSRTWIAKRPACILIIIAIIGIIEIILLSII